MTKKPAVLRYQILVEGTVNPAWAKCLAGLTITVRELPAQPTVSLLSGPLADQGALQGVLDTLFMLNLPLIRVERCTEV